MCQLRFYCILMSHPGCASISNTHFLENHTFIALVSTSDWDDHIFAHTLEGDNISSNSTGNSILTTFQQQQQEQYDVPPLVYSQNDQALAQELEKQVKKQDLTSVCMQIYIVKLTI